MARGGFAVELISGSGCLGVGSALAALGVSGVLTGTDTEVFLPLLFTFTGSWVTPCVGSWVTPCAGGGGEPVSASVAAFGFLGCLVNGRAWAAPVFICPSSILTATNHLLGNRNP